MKLLLCDLDDTIVDTAKFKNDLFARLAHVYEVSLEEVEKIYAQHTIDLATDDWLSDFTTAFDQDIWFTTKDLPRMGFALQTNPTVLSFISQFDGDKILLTYGNRKLQQYKIDQCNLKSQFDSIIITQSSKLDLFRSWEDGKALTIDGKQYTNIVVVDNDIHFLDQVRAVYPWIQTINPQSL